VEKETVEESRELKSEGKAPTTQAGPFVKEEVEHVREGKHGARSTKQAIAIGLSKARRAGVRLPTPKRGRVSARTRASIASAKRRAGKKPSPTRARAVRGALKREPTSTVSRAALARQARSAARTRGPAARKRAAARAVRTKGAAGRSAAAKKAARTRARRS
jgi:predicted SPOUT superfamily RNA methylase MTH1